MTKAKITAEEGFRCAPEGHTVITIPQGTIVEGDIAEWALEAKAASRMMEKKPPENKAEAPAETKTARRSKGK